MRFLVLTLALFGCATPADYSRFQEATMCMQGPTKLYRDPALNVCWFTAGETVLTAPCESLSKIGYCKLTPEQAEAMKKAQAESKETPDAPKPDPKPSTDGNK